MVKCALFRIIKRIVQVTTVEPTLTELYITNVCLDSWPIYDTFIRTSDMEFTTVGSYGKPETVLL